MTLASAERKSILRSIAGVCAVYVKAGTLRCFADFEANGSGDGWCCGITLARLCSLPLRLKLLLPILLKLLPHSLLLSFAIATEIVATTSVIRKMMLKKPMRLIERLSLRAFINSGMGLSSKSIGLKN
jgi:hypothetical protein